MLSYRNYYNDCYSVLYHHGVKGQKWGKRQWQNKDGSLTPEGYEHYGYGRIEGNTLYADVDAIARRERTIDRRKKKDKDHEISDFAQAVMTDESKWWKDHAQAAGILATIGAYWVFPPAMVATIPATVVGALAGSVIGNQKAKSELKKEGLYYANSLLGNSSSSTAKSASKVSSGSRVTGKEESDFWKAYAAQQTSSSSSGKKYKVVPTERRTTYVVV